MKRVNEVGRRGFLASAAAVAGGGLVAADRGAAAAAVQTPATTVPFHGAHQAGIVTPAQRATAFVSFDTTADSKSELTDLLRTLTERARFLTTGGSPEDLGITAPPSDSGTLGPDLPADRQPMLRGLALPDDVLQKLYHDNAAKLLRRIGMSFMEEDPATRAA